MSDPVVLIAEGHSHTRRVLGEIFRNEGFEPLLAADGAEALAHLRRVEPVLVITELRLRRVNGIRLNDERRRDPRTAAIPCVLLTSLPARSTEHLVTEFDAILHEPYSLDALVANARRLCARHDALVRRRA